MHAVAVRWNDHNNLSFPNNERVPGSAVCRGRGCNEFLPLEWRANACQFVVDSICAGATGIPRMHCDIEILTTFRSHPAAERVSLWSCN